MKLTPRARGHHFGCGVKMKYKVGEHHHCPKCGTGKAKIVWISEDGKTIAVQCPTSHMHKRDAVMLIDVEE